LPTTDAYHRDEAASPIGSTELHVPAAVPAGRFPYGTILANRYRIVAPLGKGGMGEVYQADDLKLGQPVALKFLTANFANDPERLRLFHNEVRVARQVSHPNVCRVYDIGERDGEHFLTMEFIDGEDLASLLRREGRVPHERGIELARQLSSGLAAVHEQGILHRDLKPHNIMLDGRGRLRITDFGLAGFAEDLKNAESRAGTIAYMAPEQLTGRKVSVQSDLYALGLVLYELFTGQRPFPARQRDELVRMQKEQSPAPPTSLVEGMDPCVEAVILHCLERHPADRPRSAEKVTAALPADTAGSKQLRNAVFVRRVKQLLDLYTLPLDRHGDRRPVPTIIIFMMSLPLGIPLAILTVVLYDRMGFSEEVYNRYVLLMLLSALAVIFLPAAILLWIFTRFARRRAIREDIQKLVADYPQQVQHWGGVRVLSDRVQLKALIRLLEKGE